MRHNKRPGVYALLTADDVPRTAEGQINLCHHCQRDATYCGSFTELLAVDLYRLATETMQQFGIKQKDGRDGTTITLRRRAAHVRRVLYAHPM